jgi:hypothetical protein
MILVARLTGGNRTLPWSFHFEGQPPVVPHNSPAHEPQIFFGKNDIGSADTSVQSGVYPAQRRRSARWRA